MFEGMYAEKTFTQPEIRPYPIEPQETSGYYVGSQSIYKYSLKESDYPTLTLVEPLYDNLGHVIRPGFYELALSDSREFLILLESKNPAAIIPVIKIEEDDTEQERLNNKKVKKELKKEKKEREKTNKKRAKVGMPPDEEKVFSEAKIEYNNKENYYIIKYQRGTIKAWGAFRG